MLYDWNAVVLQTGIPEFLEQTIAEIVAFLPRLLGATVILLVGWLVGVAVMKVVQTLTDKVELDEKVVSTPLGKMMGNSERGVSHTFGVLAKWFVYAIAILAAAIRSGIISPSAITGSEERLWKQGLRILNRAGLDVPSLRM